MKDATQEWRQIQMSDFLPKTGIIIYLQNSSGYDVMLGSDQVLSVNEISSGNIINGSIAQQKVTFTAFDDLGRLDYDDEENSNYFYGTEASFAYSVEGVPALFSSNHYYVTDTKKVGKHKVTFNAASILAFMTEKIEESIYFTFGVVISGYDLALAVIHQARESVLVPEDDIIGILDEEELEKVNFVINDDDNFSLAEILQMVAHGCGCLLNVAGKRIMIHKLSEHATNYVLSDKVAYGFAETKYNPSVDNLDFVYNHGKSSVRSQFGDGGGRQQISNPIFAKSTDQPDSLVVVSRANSDFQRLRNSRKVISNQYRYDPCLDLFDIVVIANGEKIDVGCITKINASYNGAWKAQIEVTSTPDISVPLTIFDLEQLTIEQVEALRIQQMSVSSAENTQGGGS